MNQDENNYRGHVVIPSYSGPTEGPWAGNYSVWRLNEGQYENVLSSFVPEVFDDSGQAVIAATKHARDNIDKLLDEVKKDLI